MRPIRVVVADDHELILKGLRGMIRSEPDIEVVGSAASGEELLAVVHQTRPDVAVVDIQLPDRSGLECLREIRARELPTRVVILTAYSDGESMQAALEARADGIALKTEPPEHTLDAIRQVSRGQLVYPQAALRWLAHRRRPAPGGPWELTERELQILELLAQGRRNTEIARRLHLSENTVKFHLQNLYQKLGVTNRTEAAAAFLQHKV